MEHVDVLEVGRLLDHRAAVVLPRLLEVTLGHELVTGPDITGGVGAHLKEPQPADDAAACHDRDRKDEQKPRVDSGCHL